MFYQVSLEIHLYITRLAFMLSCYDVFIPPVTLSDYLWCFWFMNPFLSVLSFQVHLLKVQIFPGHSTNEIFSFFFKLVLPPLFAQVNRFALSIKCLKMKSRETRNKKKLGFPDFFLVVTRRERIIDDGKIWQSNQDNREETKQKIEVAVKLYRDVTYERRDGNYQKVYKKKSWSNKKKTVESIDHLVN